VIGDLPDEYGIAEYFSGLEAVSSEMPVDTISEVIDLLLEAFDKRKQVFAMGNGGHCCTASHFVQDLVKHTIVSDTKDEVVWKGKRFKALSLCESMSSLTTWANDVSYEACFSEQLKGWVEEGDLVFGFTSSGNSKNILEAFETARSCGAKSVCITGKDGGKARNLADICLIVPTYTPLFIEDAHLAIVHVMCNAIRSAIQKRPNRNL
jgi:D-sedoheptulose 7-phosphate isomerase